MSSDTAKPCSECDKVELEKKLAAEEALHAFEREEQKIGLEHANDLDSAEDTATTELQKARWESEFSLAKLFHEKISEVAAGSVERSRDSAKYIQTASAAIATLYTGSLGLVFSVTDHPLPLRGVFATVFLGLSVALAAAYLAFITTPRRLKMFEGGASMTEQQMNRTAFLIKWVNTTVRDRRWAIRASVLCLGFGVAFIPAAFISSHRPAAVPAAPAAPTIPGEVAPSLTTQATKLFEAQAKGFEEAVEAQSSAVTKASEESEEISAKEKTTNLIALALALGALIMALLGPVVWEKTVDKKREEKEGDTGIAAPAAAAPAAG
ncbi:MAG TPA: hypothetical protein VFI17_07665 [Solirubrobacterales bacterium]|nr:hypothetical protein [Solirubrobacterales bacterium]